MSITITVPNGDHVALRAMAKALEEIAVARGAPLQVNLVTQEMLDKLKETRSGNIVCEPEVDTTSQQVDSLAQQETLPEKLNRLFIDDDVTPTTDSTGTPWDERIHSTSKALNADGTWRLRRKPKDMDEAEWVEYVEEVKSVTKSDEQHREKNEQVLEEEYPSVIYASEPSVTPEGDGFHVDTGEVTEQEVAAIPAPPLPPVPNAVTIAAMEELESGKGERVTVNEVVNPTIMSFPDVMKFLTERHTRITNDQVLEIIGAMGLKNIMDLNTQPEHTGPFIARVKALLGE